MSAGFHRTPFHCWPQNGGGAADTLVIARIPVEIFRMSLFLVLSSEYTLDHNATGGNE